MIDSYDNKSSPKNQGLFSTKEAAKILIVNNCQTPPFLLQYFLFREVLIIAKDGVQTFYIFYPSKGGVIFND